MSRGKRELSSEEVTLWRRVAESVKGKRGAKAPVAASPQPPAPKPESTGALKTPSKPVVKARAKVSPPPNREAERRVRRGQLDIGASLDLHGHTQAGARAALARFLADAHARGMTAVIVITGVGRGGEGVLKQRLPDWLAEPDLRGLVSGYSRAHRAHGGAGAFYVLIKRKRETPL